MKISEHLLCGSDITLDESIGLHGGNAMPIRRCAVIHFTSGMSAKSSINFWTEAAAKGACAHVVIDRDGHIYQTRAFNRTAGHAGNSRWQDPKTDRMFGGANSYAIGIELANAGNDDRLFKVAAKLPGASGKTIVARHRNGGKTVAWEVYSDPQLESCIALCKLLVQHYNLDDITGHDCIAPERKDDPGPAFPMNSLRTQCGFTGLPKVHNK
jgi:N-acetylmuramoyl-L-alanine amidase